LPLVIYTTYEEAMGWGAW